MPRSLNREADGAGDPDEAVRLASDAAKADPGRWQAWDLLARALEDQRDFEQAFIAHSKVLELQPDSTDVFGDLGRAALGSGNYVLAENCLAGHLGVAPDAVESLANLARAQMAQQALDRALATLKDGLAAHPAHAPLWILLGQVLCRQGRASEASVFFEEALRLDGASALARDGLADALLLGTGEADRALEEGAAALVAADRHERPSIATAQARRLLAAGRMEEGWDLHVRALEGGLDYGAEIKVAAPRWIQDTPLPERVLLVLGEERVADEVQFAQALPPLLAQGVPVVLAIDPSWRDLAQRSFAGVTVVPLLHRRRRGLTQYAAALDSPHGHGGRRVAAWTTLRSLAARREADAQSYLTPGADRVAQWSDWLRSLGPGPKVGAIWREPGIDAHAAPDLLTLPGFLQALSQPGVQLISLQAGTVAGEVAAMRSVLGVDLHEPPGLDPAQQLDDLAALACALAVVIGPRCAATNVAAACGARVWFLAPSRSWPLAGTDRYPEFPQAQVFSAAGPEEWEAAMGRVGGALGGLHAR